MEEGPIKRKAIIKVDGDETKNVFDAIAIEEPLEIRLEYGPENERQEQNLSVTMRTPGHDAELAAGFLFTEGIIKTSDDIAGAEHIVTACTEGKQNVIRVRLKEGFAPNLNNSGRNFYTTSSCGVCGKSSIDAIRTVSASIGFEGDNTVITSEILCKLPGVLKRNQVAFADTGGIHAAALFNVEGDLLLLREDVGRHNALDKLIGAALDMNWVPLNKTILLLSGRASFELVQKAAIAGIKVIAAIGAPSSLAVELAEEFNITLVGFVKDKRFNIYTASHRILLPVYEATY